jgi:hypothetical protein
MSEHNSLRKPEPAAQSENRKLPAAERNKTSVN